MALSKKDLAAWLLREGFVARYGQTSHVQYTRDGVTITVAHHGTDTMTKKHVGLVCRQLERVGYDRAALRREWRL